jgi:DNA invertase Pin-like site-specific DNA recombinase
MPLYGYARVSTIDQDLRLQRAALKGAGCDVIRAEKASGARRDGRTELQVLLDFVRPGDTLYCYPHRSPGSLDEGPAGHRA